MPEKRYIVLDPTLEVEVERVASAPRRAQIHVLGLVDNGKPNSEQVLRQVAELLNTHYSDMQIKYYRKPGAYRPAPSTLLDQVAAECDSVLVGIGD